MAREARIALAAAALLATACTTPGDDSTGAKPVEGRTEIRVAPPVPPALPGRSVTWRRIESKIVFLDYQGRPMTDRPWVEHADHVRAGEPLKVTIQSFGGGCEAGGGADGLVQGLDAEIWPWDYTHVPEGPAGMEYVCTTPLNVFRRTVDVVFQAPGPATVRVHGIRSHGREPERPITLTSTVRVE